MRRPFYTRLVLLDREALPVEETLEAQRKALEDYLAGLTVG